MNFLPVILLFIGGAVLTIGDIVMRFWVDNNKLTFYGFGLGLYFIGLLFLAQSYKYTNIAIASAIFIIFNLVILIVVSNIIFNDKLSIWQIIGFIFAIIAILFMNFGLKG